MQELEKRLIDTRAASPTRRIGAEIAPDGGSVRFFPLSLCEHCAREIEISGGFSWIEWGWFKGDYNRAEAYADATEYAHHAQFDCATLMQPRSN